MLMRLQLLKDSEQEQEEEEQGFLKRNSHITIELSDE